MKSQRVLIVLKNSPNDEFCLKDNTPELLAQFINNSESSRKSSEEQGSLSDKTFESLKSLRSKRMRGMFESPKFQSVSSPQSSIEMSFWKSRGSNQSTRKFLIANQTSKNMFKRNSNMFSFNGENMSTIKSFLSSKKSISSNGEDFEGQFSGRRNSPLKHNTPEFISKITQRKSLSKYKRRMGQFYPTILLKKIAELPEYESEDDSEEKTKSWREEDKSGSFKLSNENSFSNEIAIKTQIDVSKGSIEESSSIPSSVSSKHSSIKNQIKPLI